MTRDYYFGYFDNFQNETPSIMLITQDTQFVFYLIEAPGVGYFASGNFTNNQEIIVNLPTTLVATSHNDQDKGIHLMIRSDTVTVIGQNLRPPGNSIDTFLCLPIVDLCVSEYVYYGISVPRTTRYRATFLSAVLVIGTENNTMMKLTVTQPITISVTSSTVNLTAGIQYSFMIRRLQTVLIESLDDLTGTKIVTDKPVSVLSGHECGNVPGHLGNCDHLVEQIPPTTLWGRVYYTAPLATRRSYTIKILAAFNSTVVDICCNNTRESYNIGEGESVNKTLMLQEYCAIYSNKHVLMAQFSHGYRDDDVTGDPMMILVPATNQYSNKFQSSTLQGISGYTHYINIIVLAQYYQPDMIYLISGGVNRSLDTHQWVPIMVNNVAEAYGIHVNISEGVTEITHGNTAALMSTIVYGFSPSFAYGHSDIPLSHPGSCINDEGFNTSRNLAYHSDKI